MGKDFFKRIENPNGFRRLILESSKDIIQNLKGRQKIISIRKQKVELIKELKINLKEINVLLDRLKDFFPPEVLETYIEESKKTEEKKVKKGKKSKKGKKNKKTKVVKKASQKPSELTILENKLANIESKLKSLS